MRSPSVFPKFNEGLKSVFLHVKLKTYIMKTIQKLFLFLAVCRTAVFVLKGG